ncbi:hypothetical protein QBC47DRAFT_368888 [Echria macrotheca]|uniref:Uncharacterized protein n=1 Tax=Echria macrotheca TaxID=438768 RepID=A0AAJ0BQA6_9PEZI|nr:hypothetical protein QBC47DRAFT_368888 [Echria macrotheca]
MQMAGLGLALRSLVASHGMVACGTFGIHLLSWVPWSRRRRPILLVGKTYSRRVARSQHCYVCSAHRSAKPAEHYATYTTSPCLWWISGIVMLRYEMSVRYSANRALRQ